MEITHAQEWQADCCNRIANGHRFPKTLVTAPNASGKTLIALVWAGLASIAQDGSVRFHPNPNQRVIFTAPIKALSQERYRQLKALGLAVGIMTGDVRMNQDAPILCVTQEVFTQRFRWEGNLRVIIDEGHYMFWDRDRFRAYADGIHHIHPDIKLLLLSATINDRAVVILEKLAGQLERYEYTGKTRYAYLYDPLDPQTLHAHNREMLIFLFSHRGVQQGARVIAENASNRQAEHQRLTTLEIADKYRVDMQHYGWLTKRKVGVYHGNLLLKEKLFMEELFRNHLITCMVTTNGLALGVNLPAEYVVFGQLGRSRSNGPIEKSNFLQMAGRAGRPGFHDLGYVGFWPTPFELKGFSTGQLFSQLVKMPLEDPVVPLEINVRDLLRGRTTLEDEFDFLHRLNASITIEAVQQQWKGIRSNIKGAVKSHARNMRENQAIRGVLAEIFTPELAITENVRFAAMLALKGSIDVRDVMAKFEEKRIDGKCMRELLIYLKFLRSVEDQVSNLDLLVDLINQADPHYLTV